MDTESVEFLEGLPVEIKEYFFKVRTYPLKSYFSALPNGVRPRAEPKTDQDKAKEEQARAALIAQWSGNRPPQIARMMLCEYFKKFPSCTLHKVTELRKSFFKKRITWDNIDGKLKAAAQICRQQRNELAYWDLMRFAARQAGGNITNVLKRKKEVARRLAVEKTPKQIKAWVIKQNLKEKGTSDTSSTGTQYTYEDGKAYVTFSGKKYGLLDERYEVPDEEHSYIFEMSPCRYCWRAAFKPYGEQWSYCHLHQNPKELSKNYIKYAAMVRPNNIFFTSAPFMKIWERIEPSNLMKLRRISNGVEEYTTLKFQEIWERAPRIIIERLPNVYKLFKNIDPETISTELIVSKLELPLPVAKESTNKAHIRKRYYNDFAQDYATYAPHLILAELWLKHKDEPPKRGGVRNGAGRPRQRPSNSISENDTKLGNSGG